jgi:NADP-dependent 3-hydroxy acid dehydrogenase YdfG
MSQARTALVTGASSGVGEAVACALGALGWPVAIGARRADRLRGVADAIVAAGGRAIAAPLDVTVPASVDAFFATAEAALGPIDVVVSNAGIGVPGLLHEVSPDDMRREIETNLLGSMYVARRALPSMLAHRRGDLVFVSSMNVVEPRPFQAGYTAAKSGVEGMAHALRMELEGTGVRTTIVRLGPTRSEFGFGWPPEVLIRVLDSWKELGFMRHLEMLEPADVADAVVRVVTAPPGVSTDVVQLNPDGTSRG